MKNFETMRFVLPVTELFERPDPYSQHVDEALYGMECRIVGLEEDFYKINMEYGMNAMRGHPRSWRLGGTEEIILWFHGFAMFFPNRAITVRR